MWCDIPEWSALIASGNVDATKWTKYAFFAACYEGDLDLLTRLVKAGVNIEIKDDFGNCPIHLAANEKIVKFLLEQGADINAQDNNGCTILHMRTGLLMIKFLLENGADIHVTNKNHLTPMGYMLEITPYNIKKQQEIKDLFATFEIQLEKNKLIQSLPSPTSPFIQTKPLRL